MKKKKENKYLGGTDDESEHETDDESDQEHDSDDASESDQSVAEVCTHCALFLSV